MEIAVIIESRSMRTASCGFNYWTALQVTQTNRHLKFSINTEASKNEDMLDF